MGFLDGFQRKPKPDQEQSKETVSKESQERGPKVVGTSKGGSELLKYGGKEFGHTKMGFTEESMQANMEIRERHYDEFFGESDTVLHEVLPLVPHIDVYRYPPTSTRNFYTYVTGGMSDLPMHSPEETGRDCRRVELVFYSESENKLYAEWLRTLAHFPHDNHTWLHWGHTMPNGTPPTPLFGEGPLNTMIFMGSILRPDNTLGELLSIDSDPVNLVWVVPITQAECELKLEKGVSAIYDLFDEHKHPHVFCGQRKSYV